MSYYGAGDYYGAGGILGTIGGAIKSVGRVALGVATGGIGGGLSAAASLLPRTPQSLPGPTLSIPSGGGTRVTVAPMAALPGGQPLFSVGRRRRRMNFANGKALGRANRRVDGFVRLARKSLKHTQYRIVTKGSGRKSKPSVFVETGPGGIRA